MPKARPKRVILKIIFAAVAVVIGFIILAPFVWMIISSIQREPELLARVSIIPRQPTFYYYAGLFRDPFFSGAFYSSLLVSGVVTVLCVALASLGAYSLARVRFPFRRVVHNSIMVAYMLPVIALAIPLMTIFRFWGLLDTYPGLILGHAAILLPFDTWLMIGSFAAISQDQEDAARIDGCGRFKTMVKVMLPSIVPVLATVAVFTFIISWNELLMARTVGVFRITLLAPAIVTLISPTKLIYPQVFAAGTLAGLPIIVLALLFHKHIFRQIGAGAIR